MHGAIANFAIRAALKSALMACVLMTCTFLTSNVAFIPMPASAAVLTKVDRDLEDRLRKHIQILASDEFEGRAPGTEGEAKTLRYLGKEWFEIGLVSGTNDPSHEWFSPVTLIAREPAGYAAQFIHKGHRIAVADDQILALTSGKRSLIRGAPLLFVGNAPGQVFTRNELAGRVVLLLDSVNSGQTAQPSERQNLLLDQGASAVLTVLDGERSLDQVRAWRRRVGYALADGSGGGDLEAFVTRDAMAKVLQGSSRSLESLTQAAQEPGFVAIPLDVSVTLEAATRETTIRTHNLIGKLPGRRPGTGAVLLLAHWDHFGICGKPDVADMVCNGAIDNASGVAALTEVARRLARGPQIDRDVYFLATTAEELGLLGAHAFAENPPLPPHQIVAAFNIDSVAINPRGTPFAIVGRGLTPLDADIEKVAKAERMHILPGDAANEYVRRQDGWALQQHDIPAVMVTTAYGDISRMQSFFDGDYHRPTDDLSRPLQLGGAADDVRMLTALARWFGDTRKVGANPK